MYLHQLLVVSLLSGFLSGLSIQASVIFLHPERKLRYGYVFSMVSAGVIWGVTFVILSFVYFNSDMVPKDNIRGLMISLAVGLPLVSVAFELCAAVRRFQANRNIKSGDSDLDS